MSAQAASLRAEDPKRRVLKDVFGFDDFRPGQADVMDALLGGRHVLAVMPTGAGKSLCYQVPALVLGGLTLVVSPLVALAHDQVVGRAAGDFRRLHGRPARPSGGRPAPASWTCSMSHQRDWRSRI